MFEKEERKKFANIAVVIAITIFIASIRISPTIAITLSKVPGLQYIVKLMNYDNGIKDIVENNFVQSVNLSEEHEDLVFTIKDIIIDNSKCILFYSIEDKGNHKFVNLHDMKFTDEFGKELAAPESWSMFTNNDMSIEKKLEGNVELNFTEETIIPNKLFIIVKLQESKENTNLDKQKALSSQWKFEIPINKEKFESMNKVYNVYETVQIEGQKIYFKTLTITPTRIALLVEYDRNNTKKILGFDDLSIFNEKGEEWARINNGVTSIKKNEYQDILYFQSNYFTNPKELYIKGTSIRALDKDKLEVIVDMNKKELLKSPDNKLMIKSITNDNNQTTLEFFLIADKRLDKKCAYSIFDGDFKDGSGVTFKSKGRGTRIGKSSEQSILYNVSDDIKYKSPIYLKIYDYPSRIKGDFKLKVNN
ncbi:DUF4179 domain-containing protein [Clostridium lundense]|uniref:DUF4179 domain-containing protein n=1 Tax=Clostridium lundense TaxID=319475 RepID=UPI00048627D6|nr:DUF4179 domain-containing protein [Clostridium lundense]